MVRDASAGAGRTHPGRAVYAGMFYVIDDGGNVYTRNRAMLPGGAEL